MPDDPRDQFKPKTPPQSVADALASGGSKVPRDFASGQDPITGVGLKPAEEIIARTQRIQSTTDATATVITGTLAEHTAAIGALQVDVGEIKATVADIGDIKVSVAEMAGAMPHITSAVQQLTSAAIQRETIISVKQIEVDAHEKIAESEIIKEKTLARIETAKHAKIAKIERGTKLWAIAATLLAIGLAALELLR